MKKLTAVILTLLMLLSLVACSGRDAVLDEVISYEITGEILSLDIRINAADFRIEKGDELSVSSNLRYLSVSEEEGVLTVVDEAKSNLSYREPVLTVYIPEGKVFDSIVIHTGAGMLTVDTLAAASLEMKLGAGDAQFNYLNVSSGANIRGGVGEITIADGSIGNLALEMGVGELSMRAAVLGVSDLKFGIGESNLTLLGDRDSYKISVEKGLGNITVDGRVVSDFADNGSGANEIRIHGGVGTINLIFEK